MLQSVVAGARKVSQTMVCVLVWLCFAVVVARRGSRAHQRLWASAALMIMVEFPECPKLAAGLLSVLLAYFRFFRPEAPLNAIRGSWTSLNGPILHSLPLCPESVAADCAEAPAHCRLSPLSCRFARLRSATCAGESPWFGCFSVIILIFYSFLSGVE